LRIEFSFRRLCWQN